MEINDADHSPEEVHFRKFSFHVSEEYVIRGSSLRLDAVKQLWSLIPNGNKSPKAESDLKEKALSKQYPVDIIMIWLDATFTLSTQGKFCSCAGKNHSSYWTC